MSTEATTVLIVDDHAVVRSGLEMLLGTAPDLTVVASVATGEEAVARSQELRPDLVVMDLSLPGIDGIEATRRVVAGSPTTRVVVLTSFSDRERILAAVDAGALGYLLKDAEPRDLLAGLRAAARGEAPFDPKAATALLADRTVRGAPEPTPLTRREEEVLRLVAEGLGNKQIARKLGISEKTVKTHLTNLFQRIGVSDRTQAALWAHRHGLLES